MKPPPRTEIILFQWHKLLGLARQSRPSWHRDRIREELRERKAATTFCSRLSETSDVLFSLSRARYDGNPVRRLPPFVATRNGGAYLYMVAKYTSRWTFYRSAAWLCNCPNYYSVREVVNPAKDEKLDEVASRHDLPNNFREVAGKLRSVWPLLP
ncbi:hypothetical protein V8F33_010582 [Rhypophila sp. PSN 637]